MLVDEVHRHGIEFMSVRCQTLHQTQFKRLVRREQTAFHQIGLCTHEAEQAGHFGDASGAGNQAQ